MPSATRILGLPSANADVGARANSGVNNPSRHIPLSKELLASDQCFGCQIDNYTILERIGSGGMGCVYHAKHNILDKSFAIKFLSDDISQNREAIERFQQEVKAVGKLQHANIVQAIDAGEANGIHYLVTELLQGIDLTGFVTQSGPLPWTVASEIIRQAALGLSCAHRHGFVHRDIKPSNLFLQNNGTVKLLDFGIAKTSGTGSELTQAGQFIGTVDYLSPEQAENPASVDAQSDIYSLGCSLIYLLSGEAPFPDHRYPSIIAKLKGHMMDSPGYLAVTPKIPAELRTVLQSMLQKERGLRAVDCEMIATSLSAFADPKSVVDFADRPPNRKSNTKTKHRILISTMCIASLLVMVLVGFCYELSQKSSIVESKSEPKSSLIAKPTASSNSPSEVASTPDVEKLVSDPVVQSDRHVTLPTNKIQSATAIEFSTKQLSGLNGKKMIGHTSKPER